MPDIANNTSTTGTIKVNGIVRDAIETIGDKDWFKIYLEAGVAYTINLEGVYTTQGTLPDPLIDGIYNSAGTLVSGVTIVDDVVTGTNRNSRATFTPTSSGNYFISAGGYDTNIGTYRLAVSSADGYTANVNTSGYVFPLDAFGFVELSQGNIGAANQVDWFKADLLAGITYTINLEGSPTDQGTLTDPFLRGIYNSSGTLLGYTDDDSGVGLNSQVSFTPTTDGTYFIAAGANGANTGTYALSLTATDDFAANTSTTGKLTLNGTASRGAIQALGDTDWFKVTLAAGINYTFDVEGADTSKGTLAFPIIGGIYNSAGGLIANTEVAPRD